MTRKLCLCRQGNVVKEIAYLPLAEDIPIAFNSCRKGPRGIDWRSDKDAEFSWIEAQVHAIPISCLIELRGQDVNINPCKTTP